MTVLPWCIVVRVQLVLYLIENKMSSLSGRPQKIVVNILEEIVNQGAVLLTLKTTHLYRMICEIHWGKSSLAKTKVIDQSLRTNFGLRPKFSRTRQPSAGNSRCKLPILWS